DAPAGPVVLQCRKLSFSYASRPLLRNLSFELRAGELVLIEGENGSGKTTLLLLLAGVLDPESGSVELGDDSRSLGVLLQSPEDQLVCPSVLEDVALGPRRSGRGAAESNRRARKALAESGLEPGRFEDRPPSSLSHGERRRVAWAGLAALGAGVWLLDEPSSGLDRPGVLALRNAIEGALRGGVAVVMI